MMINSCSDTQQEIVPAKNVVFQDSVRLKAVSASTISSTPLKDSLLHTLSSAPNTSGVVFPDTTSVCERNIIADITFYDSNNVVSKIESGSFTRFPFIFTEKTRQLKAEARASLIKQLKPGLDIPSRPLHDDWIVLVIITAAFLYSLVRTASKNIFSGVTRFFLFRGINDPVSRDIGGLFHWQSTILNFISFIIIGLFIYNSASFYDVIPSSLKGIIFWFISFGIIVVAVTLRHIVCLITGSASGQREVFREYLLAVYQSYRFCGLFLFIIIILMSYTVIIPAKICFLSGIIILCAMYFIRVIRLFIIFINRNISIFYLILYLCALEILPVVISVKYFTGLV